MEISALIIQALTVGGSTASILGVFLYFINRSNHKLLREMDRRHTEILNRMDERTAKMDERTAKMDERLERTWILIHEEGEKTRELIKKSSRQETAG